MFYDFAITIPANTAKSSPVEQELNLTYGIVHRIEVHFPAYCAGLAHLIVKRFEQQLWPTNPDGSFASDNYTIAFSEHYSLETSPYTLKVEAWNEDDTWPHTITLRIGILPLRALSPWEAAKGLLRRLVGKET